MLISDFEHGTWEIHDSVSKVKTVKNRFCSPSYKNL